jgi:hypothetical protein
MRFCWCCIAIAMGFAATAMADAPATQPALGPADTFRVFLLDVKAGNADDLVKLCAAKQDDARQLEKDFWALSTAMGDLRKAVTAKFGADAVDSVLPALLSSGDLSDLDEKITGDSAEVDGASLGQLQLIRIQGQWKLNLDWMIQSPDMPQNPRWFGSMAKAIERTSADVSSGRLSTISAAAEAMVAREQAIPDTAPTTESTTSPSTQP